MKPPRAVIPPLYQEDATIRIPAALWKEFQLAIADYEETFGKQPTPEEIEKSRSDIQTWHYVGDWFCGFEQRHYRLMGQLMDRLLEAAAQKGETR